MCPFEQVKRRTDLERQYFVAVREHDSALRELTEKGPLVSDDERAGLAQIAADRLAECERIKAELTSADR